MQPFRSNRFRKITNEVAMWAHPHGRPVRKPAVVHREAVMMLEDWHHVLRSGLLEQPGPSRWIEFLSFEFRNEILVAELLLTSVSRDVVLVLRRSGRIHQSWVPLTTKRRHRIHAPVNEDSEL